MFKLIRRVFIFILLLLIVLIGASFVLPTTYTVERTAVINATTDRVHELVGDLANWDQWTPWKQHDPTIQITRGLQTTGPGATQSWTGESGSGSLTITESAPEKGIRYDLSFDRDAYRCRSAILYTTLPDGRTEVTWVMQGRMNTPVVGPYFALAMDPLLAGPLFQQGLDNLNAVASAPPADPDEPAAPDDDNDDGLELF